MSTALQDMFTGWKSGTVGRLKFGLYFAFLFILTAISIFFFLKDPLNLLSNLFFWFATLLQYDCGLLIIIKRYRELTRFPVLFALLHWGVGVLALRNHWPALAVVSLVFLLILLVAPGYKSALLTDDQNESEKIARD